jgi:hypothetical protein
MEQIEANTSDTTTYGKEMQAATQKRLLTLFNKTILHSIARYMNLELSESLNRDNLVGAIISNWDRNTTEVVLEILHSRLTKSNVQIAK